MAKKSFFPSFSFSRSNDSEVSSKAKKKKSDPDGQTGRQTPGSTKIVWTGIFNRREYREMRLNIPLVDRAIILLSALNGTVHVRANKDRQERIIRDFMENIPVRNWNEEGTVENNGINEALFQLSDMTFEQGFGIVEAVRNENKRSINRLQVPDSLTFEFRDEFGGKRTLYQQQITGTKQIIPDPFLKVFAWEDRGGEYYSLLWNLKNLSDKTLRMYSSLENLWARFGDPSMLYLIGADPNEQDDVENPVLNTVMTKLSETIDEVFKARERGRARDAYQVVPQGTKIDQTVIGTSSATGSMPTRLNFTEDIRSVLEQLTVKTGLPGWMLQQSWSTTERLSTEQRKMVLNDANLRQAKLKPTVSRLVRNFLDSDGKLSWTENQDYELYFKNADIEDALEAAKARKEFHESEKSRLENIAFKKSQGWIDENEAKEDALRHVE